MSLQTHLESSGNWLFRNRSYAPLAIIPLIAIEVYQFSYLGQSHEINEYWQVGCLCVSLFGFAIRILTVGCVPSGTSGRNTQEQRADHLNTTGIYSVVRHPLYIGNYFIYLGFILFFHSWEFALAATSLYIIYYERIALAEEDFLRQKYGTVFEDWASRTPAVIPRFSLWKSSELPFSTRTVLRREYTGFMLITIVFALFDEICDSVVEGRWILDVRWIYLVIAGGCVYLTLRSMKKMTRWLKVAGR